MSTPFSTSQNALSLVSSSNDEKTELASFPIGVCVKVEELRPKYKNLKEWCNTDGNILVTRAGRVFITENNRKNIFMYQGSEWQNRFKVTVYGLEECLRLYEENLIVMLKDKKCLERFKTLLKAKEIGCFCKSGEKCHRDIILRYLSKYR